jgi:hypothetical protein
VNVVVVVNLVVVVVVVRVVVEVWWHLLEDAGPGYVDGVQQLLAFVVLLASLVKFP